MNLTERITAIIKDIDELNDNNDNEEILCKEIIELERNEIDDVQYQLSIELDRISSSQNLSEKSYEKYYINEELFQRVKNKIKKIKQRTDLFDPKTEMQIMFPDGTGDIEYDASYGIGGFEKTFDEDDNE